MEKVERILVLGSEGFLGSHFMECYAALGDSNNYSIEMRGYSGKISRGSIKHDLEVVQNFNTIINCIALRDIEACEKNQSKANFVNSTLPFELALVCEREGKKLVHLSTDAVYGDLKEERNEDSYCVPKSVYAKSKLQGESWVLEANTRALVVRTNFFGYSKRGPSLVNFVLDSLSSNRRIPGFTDVLFNAVYVDKLVKILIELSSLDLCGVFNVGNEDSLSKYEFIQVLLREIDAPLTLVYPTRAADDREFSTNRNLDLRMNVTKLKSITSHPLSIKQDIAMLAEKIKRERLVKND